MGSWRINQIAGIALLLSALLAAGIFANEAGKEVRILCSLFKPGTSQGRVDSILATARLLHVSTETAGAHKHLEISSWFNFRLTGCSVTLEEEVVTVSEYQGLASLLQDL